MSRKAKDLRSPLAKARDDWFASKDGQECSEGGAGGQYLRNRLERAFIAGAKAMDVWVWGFALLALSAIAKDEKLRCKCGSPPYTDGENCPRCHAMVAVETLKKMQP